MDRPKNRIGRLRRDTDGAVAIMAALGLLAFLGMASLAIDVGQFYYARNQLQNAADAAALAAAGNLIKDESGVAVRDAAAAQQAALTVAQRQSELAGLPTVDIGARNDLTLTFGEWNINAGNPQEAWTEVGSTCSSDSPANAIKIDLRRASGLAYGPVTNIFASVFGVNTSEVAASAIAYLGYSYSVGTGTVKVPLALPSSILTASIGHSGWFANLFGPREAVASATKTYVFKDTGGSKVASNVPTSPAAALDSTQAYFFTVGASDPVPDTIKGILKKVYTPSYTAQYPVVVSELKVGQQIYPRSEYPWGRSYIGPLFKNLKQAYDYKKDASGKWHTPLAVFGPKTVASLPQKTGFMSLARLLTPFWPTEALACTTMNPPTIMVTGFVNADITGVTANDSSCDDCSYTFPKTISGVRYNNKKECLSALTNSSWNANTVTIENVTDASTVTPSGSLSGGPSNQQINPGAPAAVGALASIPRLVK